MNAYKPWEVEGMSEEQFWRRKYIEVEMENGQLRAVMEAVKRIWNDYEKVEKENEMEALKAALEKVGGGE